MNEELTPWFRGVLKPVRKGVYKRELIPSGYVGFAYWDGVRWFAVRTTADQAVREARLGFKSSTDVAQTRWRGLANEQK